VAQFKYLRTTVTNQNLIQEESLLPFIQNILCRLPRKNIKIGIYKTIILPVVVYRCETWSLTLREEYRLRVLRKIFRQKRDEMTGDWRKLHNEALHNMYSSPNIIRIIKSSEL
jgi:hypothetical protein